MDKTFRLKNGRMLGYAEYGDPHGKPLFSLHGWPSSRLHAAVFSDTAWQLGLRVIAPDRPGFGLSDYDPDRTLLDFPDTLMELARHLRIPKFSVIGFSGGGPYAAACAYKIPKTALIRTGIVVGLGPTYIPGVLDGMPFGMRLTWQNYRKVPHLPVVASALYQAVNNTIPSWTIGKLLFHTDADRRILCDPEVQHSYKLTTGEAFRHGAVGPSRDLYLYSGYWGFDVSDIRADVRLWYGQDDIAVPLATGKFYASSIPGSKLTVIPHAGHMVVRTHAREILRAFV